MGWVEKTQPELILDWIWINILGNPTQPEHDMLLLACLYIVHNLTHKPNSLSFLSPV